MSYKETRSAYCNCNKRIYIGDNRYNIPEIIKQDIDIEDTEMLSFNYVVGNSQKIDNDFRKKICHFYIDDYQFDRIWNTPDRYIGLMKKFKAVLAPDFSLYDDFPVAVNLYNHYRKHWIARYWQEHGVTVIPTLCWADNSMDFCFDGTPKHATVSISTIGCTEKDGRDYWTGFYKAIEELQPSKILLFTNTKEVVFPKPIDYDCKIVRVVNGSFANVQKYKEYLKTTNVISVKRKRKSR